MFARTCRFIFALTLVVGLSNSGWAQRQGIDGAAGRVVQFRDIDEVIVQWSPDRRLYVQGDVGIGAAQLSELQAWLSQNGPHWTVVLMHNANGQDYAARDGRRYSGMDAVEYALSFGLNNRTDIGKLEHPKTQERDATIFVLFLTERKFSYYASDAQDRRNLGQAHWIGELDQPAFRAMRSGGRIIDAVKDTVKSINTKLEQAITSEANAALHLEQERKRAVVRVHGIIESIQGTIAEVASASESFRKRHVQATGGLATPPVDKWREEVGELESELNLDSARDVEQKLSPISLETSKYLNAYSAESGFEEHTARLGLSASQLIGSTQQKTQGIGSEIKALSAQARQKLESGELDFPELLAKADATNREGEAELAEEKRLEQLAKLRALWIRRTVIAMLGLTAFGLGIVLYAMNRRRRSTKEKAIAELAAREAAVARETDNIDQLFTRNHDILGSREKVEERGYTGRTRDVAMKALDYVDDLFIMSKEVKRVLASARGLIAPRDPFSQFINLFAASRYQQAIDQVTGKPIKFSRATGIPLIVRQAKSLAADSAATEKPEELPDEVTLTFEEIFAAFQKRGVEAEGALNTIESCLVTVQDGLSKAQTELERASEQEKQLEHAAQDSYLAVNHYFDTLIPSIQNHIREADQLSAFDAVQAVQESLAIAQRQLSEGQQLGNHLLQIRKDLFPKLRSTADSLKTLGYASDWIGDELEAIGQHSNDVYELAAKQSVAAQIDATIEATSTLEQRAVCIVGQAKELSDTLSQALVELASRIGDARQDVARSMKLSVDAVLHEINRDPDDNLARARANFEATKGMILQGRDKAAAAAMVTLKSEIEQADALLRATKAAVHGYEGARKKIEQTRREQETRAPQLSQAIDRAKVAYAAAALVIGASAQTPSPGVIEVRGQDSTQAAHGQSVQSVLASAKCQVQEVEQMLSTAAEQHRTGLVLAAAEGFALTENKLTISADQLEQVSSHMDRLDSQNRENETAQQHNESMIAALNRAQQNPLVTTRTLSSIEQAATIVQQNRLSAGLSFQGDKFNIPSATNPFETANLLLKTRSQLEQIQSQIVGDQQAHAEAKRAVAGASQQLNIAGQLVRQSQSDGIPDSAETTQANNRIAALARDLKSVENDLNVMHGDWRSVDERAARLQAELVTAAQLLGSELQAANQALAAFQSASQSVLQAEQWSGAGGIRVSGAPGVQELERARRGLQSGNYSIVLQISRVAALAAQAALQAAEREVARRRMEEQREIEMARRAREAAARRSSERSSGGGSFGSGFGGSFGGGAFGGGSSSKSSSSKSSSSSSGSDSGFSRSGW